MSIKIVSVFSYNSRTKEVSEITKPNKCPMCNHGISPSVVSLSIEGNNRGSITYFCDACQSCFLSRFNYESQITGSRTSYRFLQYTSHEPLNFSKCNFTDIITNLSPRFVNTYNQSLEAEQRGLSEISGMGFRKALEILVKDYVIKKHPNDKEKVLMPSYFLKRCIDEYIIEPRIKNPSIAATWIGNDETHYTRKHDDKDINDLKSYIDTVVYFIQYDLSADNASNFVGN